MNCGSSTQTGQASSGCSWGQRFGRAHSQPLLWLGFARSSLCTSWFSLTTSSYSWSGGPGLQSSRCLGLPVSFWLSFDKEVIFVHYLFLWHLFRFVFKDFSSIIWHSQILKNRINSTNKTNVSVYLYPSSSDFFLTFGQFLVHTCIDWNCQWVYIALWVLNT